MLKLSETRATWELSIAWREMPKKQKVYYPIFKNAEKSSNFSLSHTLVRGLKKK